MFEQKEYECYEEKTKYINYKPGIGYEEKGTWDQIDRHYTKEIKLKNGEIQRNVTTYEEYGKFYSKWRKTPKEKRKSEIKMLDHTIKYYVYYD